MALALEKGETVYPLSFDYGQRHVRELQSVRSVVAEMQRRYPEKVMLERIVTIGGLQLSSSALTSDMEVPTKRDEATMSKDIPVTYVPARNSIFLSVATAFAESLNCDEVYTGFNAVDYSGYPDCRPDYVKQMQAALAMGTKRGIEGRGIRITTPVIHMTKVDIVREAKRLGVPVEKTWSCYKGGDVPCGECDSCIIRDKAIAEAA
jgi:7-cyano-7-deazaguanine synthase